MNKTLSYDSDKFGEIEIEIEIESFDGIEGHWDLVDSEEIIMDMSESERDEVVFRCQELADENAGAAYEEYLEYKSDKMYDSWKDNQMEETK